MDSYEVAKIILVLVISFSILIIAIQTSRIMQIIIDSLKDVRDLIKNTKSTIEQIINDYSGLKETLKGLLSSPALIGKAYGEASSLIKLIVDAISKLLSKTKKKK